MDKIGVIHQKGHTESIGNNGFCKRDLVLETYEQYSQKILFQFTGDNCDLLDNFEIGEKVKVTFNLRGKEYITEEGETRYFNTIQGWKIESVV